MDEDDFMVQIEAKTVSEKATLSGTGFYALDSSSSKMVTISVTAENGDVRKYDILIIRP
jgi:hypothetical protein